MVKPIAQIRTYESHGDLMVFSHLRWVGVWQRPQHIVARLASQFRRTIFIEEPEVNPTATRVQLRTEMCGPVERVWLEVPGPPGHCDFLDARAATYGDLIAQRYGDAPEVAWLYTPLAFTLTTQLTPTTLVMDVMDDLSAFAHASPHLRVEHERALSACDVVFTGGQSLQRKTVQHRQDACCFPSGVELEHYGRSVAQRPASRKRPVAGYVGVIDERLDLPLLAQMAALLHDWDIHLVGPITKIDPATLPGAPNVMYFGARAYDDLPEVMAGFDVALMPFALNESTRSISPTKSLEYLAAGLPVVSTRVPDVVSDLSAFVELADDGREFAAACRRLVAVQPEERNAAVQALLRWNQWDAIVDRMSDELRRSKLQLSQQAAL